MRLDAVILLVVTSTTAAVACGGENFAAQTHARDLIEDEHDDDAPSTSDSNSFLKGPMTDLALSQEEVRHSSRSGISVGAGEASQWMNIALRAYRFLNNDMAIGGSVGGGRFSAVESPEGHARFRMNLKGTGVAARGVWWPSHTLPLGCFSDIAVHKWSGRIGIDGGSADAEVAEGALSATTLSGDAGLMVFWFGDSGIFLEWTIVGIGRSLILVATAPGQGSTEDHALRQYLASERAFGVVNIAVGYHF